MMFFAGLWLPIPQMSPGLQDISHATPLGAAVTAMADTLGGTFPPLLYLGILAGWAVDRPARPAAVPVGVTTVTAAT